MKRTHTKIMWKRWWKLWPSGILIVLQNSRSVQFWFLTLASLLWYFLSNHSLKHKKCINEMILLFKFKKYFKILEKINIKFHPRKWKCKHYGNLVAGNCFKKSFYTRNFYQLNGITLWLIFLRIEYVDLHSDWW